MNYFLSLFLIEECLIYSNYEGRKLNRIIIFLFLFSANCLAQSSLKGEFIFEPDTTKHGHTHASGIVECPNGSLLVCWYEGKTDRSEDVRIQAARLKKGAKTWSETFLLADTPTLSDNNPCLIIDKHNRLWLFYYTLLGSPEGDWKTAYLRYKISEDYQNSSKPITWILERDLPVKPTDLDSVVNKFCAQFGSESSPKEKEMTEYAQKNLENHLSRKLGWTTRARPLILSTGEMLLPMASEIFKVAMMAISPDQGKTWSFSEILDGYGVIQPTVFEQKDGTLITFMRDTTPVHRVRTAQSKDHGLTWSSVKNTDLPNPGSGLEVIKLASGNVILLYNDTTEGPRNSLAVSLSDDDGKIWKHTRHIARAKGEARYDYPSVIQSRDNKIHVTYTYNTKTIKHVVFTEQWILGDD